MTELGAPFDGLLIGDATSAPYSAAQWAHMWKLMHGGGSLYPNYGTLAGSGGGTYNPLEVRATSVISSNVDVQVGAALIDGRFYESTSVRTLSINANVSGNPRIDTVILRLDYIGQTIRLAVKQGTPAASPTRPALQQDAVYWEIPLADIAVANGFTTLAQSTITQRQRPIYSQANGWQSRAYPLNYVFGLSGGTNATLSPSMTYLTQIVLHGNMLLDDVQMYINTTSVAYQYGWDLYVEDTNDGYASENYLRRLAQSNGNASGTLPGIAAVNTLAVANGPVQLTPGAYWLAIQNRHATLDLSIDSRVGVNFEGSDNVLLRKTTTTNGATLDAANGWSNLQASLAVRLRGRVFGMSTPI